MPATGCWTAVGVLMRILPYFSLAAAVAVVSFVLICGCSAAQMPLLLRWLVPLMHAVVFRGIFRERIVILSPRKDPRVRLVAAYMTSPCLRVFEHNLSSVREVVDIAANVA